LNEISVISYRIDNYVTDTVTTTPFRIGYITADIPITVQSSTVSNQPISITPYSIGNSIGQLLVFSEPVYTNSIAQDLSEFELFANSIPITNGISNYTSSASQFGLLDSLNLHFAPNLTAGHYILHHKIGSDSTLCVGQCAQSSDDTMINITVPFPNAQITGHLSPYNSGFYKLSYANNIDSVRWSLANGTLNNSSSSTCTSAPSDSVFATLSASQCLLTAVRFGRGLTDTLSIQITPTGIGITENDLQYISAFPNPTNGIFQLNDVPLGSFDLVTREGRVIESGEIRKAYDISHLPNGVFSLRLRTAKGTQDIKIVKQ
jgi:hypothetical protein